MNTVPPTPPTSWVSTKLKRENIHAKPVTLKEKAGREITGHLEVEKVGEDGRMLVRACYNPSPYDGTVMLTAFRLSQAQMDAFAQQPEACVFILP